jgi:hypothetical protein
MGSLSRDEGRRVWGVGLWGGIGVELGKEGSIFRGMNWLQVERRSKHLALVSL